MKSDFRRAIHIDFHTMPGIYDINDFDAKQFAKLMSEAHVTYVNVFAECNIGYCYYPTKIGIIYPGLKKDILGELVEELHKYDIGVTAYINSGFNNAVLERNPEWQRRKKDGNLFDTTTIDGKQVSKRRCGCFNTGYGEYLKELVKEIIDNYNVDGIFLDSVPVVGCFCESCKKDMLERNINLDNESEVYKFSEDVRIKFASEIKEIVGDKHLFFNSWYTWDIDAYDHFELECLPNGSWTYEYFAPHAAYARGLSKDTLYMTGRFQTEWGDFGGICSKASLENDMFDALMNGFGYSVGDHAHPSKTLIPSLYKTIKEIYTDLKQYQKYNEGAVYRADVGIYSSLRFIKKYDMWKHKYVAHLLSDLKYTYNVIIDLKDVNKYPLMIIPEEVALDEEEAKIFDAYIKNGGKVLSCGMGGFNLDKTDFAIQKFKNAIQYCGKDERYHTFFEFNDGEGEDYCDIQWDTYQPSIMMKQKCGTVIAEDVKAYFDKVFDGERFIHYNPPEKKTGYAAAIVGDNIAHVSFDLFQAYGKQYSSSHRELARVLLNKIYPRNNIKAKDLPVSSRASITENDKYVILNVKTTYPEIRGSFVDPAKGVITEHVYLPAGKTVSVKGVGFKSAVNAKTGEKIVFVEKDGYTEITLPEIYGFIMVALEK